MLGIGSARFGALCGQGLGANLREAEYRKLQAFSFSNIDHFRISSLVTRLTSDVTVIQNSVSTGIRPICRAPVMLVMATGAAFMINSRLALVFLVALPVLGFMPVSYTHLQSRFHKQNMRRRIPLCWRSASRCAS